jgi:signal peptidase I
MTKLVARNVTLAALCIALLVPAALIATGRAGYRVFIVSTGSMMPSISPNSVAIVERGVYRVGQTISFMTASGVVTHRLLERRADGSLVTKGDANATSRTRWESPRSCWRSSACGSAGRSPISARGSAAHGPRARQPSQAPR